MDRLDFERLATLIRQTFNQPDLVVDRSTAAAGVAGWDSLNHTLLILRIEARFGVTLPLDETARLPDVGALADLIAARMTGGAGAPDRPSPAPVG